ncbi:MAG: serine/threonine-protein phosphatase [Spirochaetes bacterium]|nr:serine/threonine-protein phosphatase [Spirochaetota bacterium]
MEKYVDHYNSIFVIFKIFSSFIIFFLSIIAKRVTTVTVTQKYIKVFQIILALILVRDFIVVFYKNHWILLFSDAVQLASYYYFAVRLFGEHKIDVNSYRMFVFFHAIFIFLNGYVSESVSILVYKIFLISISIIIIYRLFIQRNTADQIVAKFRNIALGILVLYSFVVAFSNDVLHSHIYITPLLYFLNFYIVILLTEWEFWNNQRLIRFLKNEKQSTLLFFENIGKIIMENKTFEEVNEYILTQLIEKTEAETGAILIYDESEDKLYISAMAENFVLPGALGKDMRSKSIHLTNLFFKGKTVPRDSLAYVTFFKNEDLFIKDYYSMRHHPLFKDNTYDNILFISSIIMITIQLNDKRIGLVCLTKNTPGRYFENENYNTARSLTVYAELLLRNVVMHKELLIKKELERDIYLASEIQKTLLPSSIPVSDKFTLSLYSKAAKYLTGDYLDIFTLNSGKIAIIICDVVGKGVAAGLIMTIIRTIMHLVANQNWKTSSVIRLLNRSICNLGCDQFATAYLLVYDPETGILEYTNAAHLPALLVKNRNRKVMYLDTDGLPLGIEKNSDYQSMAVRVHDGDVIFLYSDGITEAMNSYKKQLGIEPIIQMLKENIDLNADEIQSKICALIEQFQGVVAPHDDQSFIVLKINMVSDKNINEAENVNVTTEDELESLIKVRSKV